MYNMEQDIDHTHLFIPYLLVIMGVRRAVGRYTHDMMLPNQFTSFRVNPKSRTTKDWSVVTMATKRKNRTVVGYGTKPWPTAGGDSLEHKLTE